MSRALTPHALAELENVARTPEPTTGINPGVVRKLVSEGLAEIIQAPSPFKIDRGKLRNHLTATAAGRRLLEHPNPVDIARAGRATESHGEQLAQGCAMVSDGESE